MVALLNNDISSTGSRSVYTESVVHLVGSRSGLTFGLGRRFQHLAALSVLVFALVLTVRVAQGSANETPVGAGAAGESGEAVLSSSMRSTYVVQPGDTLWGLAVELTPEGDPRPVVDQLVELNGSAMIATGEELVLPAGLETIS